MRCRRACELLLLGAVMLVEGGCRTVPIASRESPAKPAATAISKVVVLWTEAVLRANNLPVAQGFAAKVYLFGPDSREPVTTPGKFTIYAYDETATGEQVKEAAGSQPDRSWEFQESELRGLLKKDAIGWSYSIWVAYGPPTGSERRVTLRLSFTPDNERQVLSESSLVTLPAVNPVGPRKSRSTNLTQQDSADAAANSVALTYRPLAELP